MVFIFELIDELELLVFFNLNNIQEGFKVYYIVDGKVVVVV